MPTPCRPKFEALEPRQLLTTVFLGNQCLPPAPPPPISAPPKRPTPPQSTDNRPPAPGPVAAVPLVGTWQGTHTSLADRESSGHMSLDITRSTNGALYGTLDFDGPATLRVQARVNLDAKTNRFTLLTISAKFVVRIEGVIDGQGQLTGEIQYYTKHGAYKANYSLSSAR